MLKQGQCVLPKTLSVTFVNNVNTVIIKMIGCVLSVLAIKSAYEGMVARLIKTRPAN